MANISYGVNFLPKTNNTYTLGNSDYKWSTIYSVNLNITDLDVANSISMYRKSSTTIGENSVALGYNNTASGAGAVAEGYASVASGNYSHTEGGYTTASAQGAHAEGDSTTASGTNSHAEGASTTASAPGAHAEGYYTTASSVYTHTEGMYTIANSSGAHAEGSTTKSQGAGSHTEGIYTHASGVGSHAEGMGKAIASNQTVIADENYGAMGTAAHAEGYETKAYGAYSHAEGMGTITNSTSAHVFGSFNAKDTAPAYDENTTYKANDVVIKDNVFMVYTGSAWGGAKGHYVEIVGNGIADQDNLRSNARVLDWSGNERLNGTLYVGCNADSSGGTEVATKTNATTSTAGLMSAADKSKLDTVEEIKKTIDTPTEIMTFTDGPDGLPMSITAGIKPMQDLHGYGNPWPAGGGKNLWSLESQFTSTTNDGDWVLPDTAFELVAGTYTISLKNSTTNTGGTQFHFKNANGTTIANPVLSTSEVERSATFTISEDAKKVAIVMYGTVRTISNIQLESGSTATSYAPYSNICPISGWTGAKVTRTGKNISTTTVYKQNYVLSIDGREIQTENFCILDAIKVLPNTKYCISFTKGSDVNDAMRVGLFDAYMNFIERKMSYDSPFIITIPSNCKYIRLSYQNVATELIPVVKSNIQVEQGEYSSAYEAYAGTTHQISFPSSAGTVYGGTLTVNQDGTGTVVVDHVCANAKDETWYYSSSSHLFNSNFTVAGEMKNIGNVTGTDGESNIFAFETTVEPNNMADYHFARRYAAIYVRCEECTTTSEFVQYCTDNNVQFYYELATPVTYTFTAQQIQSLLGLNSVWADTGDIKELEYYLDLPINYELKRIPHDIQVNGTSIVSNGVANIPYTATGVHGLVRPGDGLYADNGQLLINSATTGIIKAGASNYLPITPKRQHEAVFYGLTKLAGVDMSSSSNAVGTYTNEAKAAIRTLIGATNPVILTYNTSTWNDFITAYTSGATIYCYDEGSTNGQYRIAQLAYVNDKTNPTYAQFQYYRARSNKTTSNLCDELIQYSLDSTQDWNVELKYTGPKTITTTNGISVSFSNNNMTISGIEATTSAAGLMSATDKTLLNNAIINEGVVADKTNITVTDAANSNIKEISYKIEPITPTTVITYSKNLLNPAARTDEYYISSGGVYTASPGDCYSGPIDVEPGDEIYIYGIAGKTGNRRIHGYTAEDVWSKQVTYFAVTLDNAFDSGKITIPSGVYKIRLSFNQADTDVMIEKGSKTSYEAYYDPITTHTFTALSTSTLYASGTSANSSNSDIVSHAITFPSDIYAVTVNIINGTSVTINKTWDYIASYDDETIGDEWYSSSGDSSTLNAPAAGDTVIYKLSTPTILTGYTASTTLPTLYSGTNYIWLSINETLTNLINELKYPKQDTLTYELPAASTHLLGGMKPGRGITMNNEVANIDIATANKLGLVKIGSNINITADGTISIAEYALKDNPVFTGSLSMGRLANSPVGTNSIAWGNDNTASGTLSCAIGDTNIVTGNYSVAFGKQNTVNSTDSFAQGTYNQITAQYGVALGYNHRVRNSRGTCLGHNNAANGAYALAVGNHANANAYCSSAIGWYTKANSSFETVLGIYNSPETADAWVNGTSYSVGDIVSDSSGAIFKCVQATSSKGPDNSTEYWARYGTRIFELGNGSADDDRSNAVTILWSGDTYIKGNLYVRANADGTGGQKVVAAGNTYTDVEKAEIQKAIGVYKAPWEVIRDVTTMTNAEEADIEITVDDDGNSFELSDIIVWMTVPSSNDFASKYGDYSRVRYYYDSNKYDDTISGEINVAIGGSSRGFYSYIEQDYPMLKKWATNQTVVSNTGSMTNYMTNTFTSQLAPALIINSPRYYNKIVFRKITGNIKFKIYGRRKWTTT